MYISYGLRFAALLVAVLSPFANAQYVGSTPGEFSVESGAANFVLPLDTPAGRGGMQPQLALSYSGGGANGPFGVGWGLSGASAIYRCGATWAQDGFTGGIGFNSKDRFCLDGQRLIRVDNANGQGVAEFRTEVDSYAQVKAFGGSASNPTYFIVKTKAGQTMTFGGSSSSQIIDNKGTLKWALRRINDTTGKNPINFSYSFNGNYQYIRDISYSGYLYRFNYESRADIKKSNVSGKQYSLARRVSTINLSHRGQALKEYRLSYQSIGATQSSYLNSVEECGYDNRCLKPVKFSWQLDGSPGFSSKSSFTPRYHVTTDTNGDLGVQFVDVNGDGLVDQLYHRWRPNGGTQKGAWINTGSGWRSDSNYAPKFHIMGDGYGDLGSRFIDVNGDGLVDQVYHRWISSGKVQKGAYINTGSGWRSDPNYAPRFHIVTESTRKKRPNGDAGSRFVDINGDGLIDQVFHRYISSTQQQKGAYINTGSGWRSDSKFTPKYHIVTDTSGDVGSQFLDVNGDGLVDQIYNRWMSSSKVQKGAWINTGSGWRSDASYTPRFHTVVENTRDKRPGGDAGSRFVDVNGDGLVDQIYHRYISSTQRQKGAYINTGTGWRADANYTPQYHIVTDTSGDVGSRFVDINGDGLVDQVYNRWMSSSKVQKGAFINTGSGWRSDSRYTPRFHTRAEDIRDKKPRGDTGTRFIDVNGDGLVDQVYYRWLSSSKQQKGAYINKSKFAHLTKITDSMDNTTAISYKTLTNKSLYKKGTGAKKPVIDVQYALPVVSEVKTNDGIGGQNTVRYTYKGLKSHTKGRGLLGFSEITETYPDTKKTKTTVIDQSVFPRFGIPTRVTERYDGDIVNDVVSTYSVVSTNGREANTTVKRVRLTRTVEKSYELGEPNQYVIAITTDNQRFDGFDNPKRVVVRTTDGNETFTKITDSMYYNNTDKWLLSRLTYSVVYHQSPTDGTRKRRVEFKYTGHGLLSEEKIVNAADTTQYLKKTNYSYNAYGQITRTTHSAPGASSRQTNMTYNSHGRLQKACNVYNECTTNTYNDKGLLATTTGPNKLTTTYTYDGLRRQVKAQGAAGIWSISGVYFKQHSACGTPAKHAYSCSVTRTKGEQPTIMQYDSFGREVRKITVGFDGRKVYSDTEYNDRSQVARVSRDYFSGDYIYWATSQYDALDRVTKITQPGPHGSTTDVRTYYNGLRTNTYSGPQKRGRTTYTNALGQTIRVEDPMGAYVEYTYYSDGNLKTTKNQGNAATVITLKYDVYGRKIESIDPDMGRWRYEYNGFGEIIRQTDAKNQVSQVVYDRLGRMVKRTEPEGQSTWTYGNTSAPVGSVGKLLKEVGQGITKDLSYDQYGRAIAITTTISGEGSFTTKMSYDGNSRVRRTTYPSTGFITENIYNANGYLNAVRGLRRSAESHDYSQLKPLISQAITVAAEYQKKAEKLRSLGKYYQSRIAYYRSLAGSGAPDSTLKSKLSSHRSELNKTVSQGNALTPKFMGHLNQAIDELAEVNKLISAESQSYSSMANDLSLLAAQTLAVADHTFKYGRTYDRVADIYQEMDDSSNWMNYWRAVEVDASGRRTAEVYGNGIVNDYTYNQGTGFLESVNSSLLVVDALKHVEYEYDAYNNVTLRDDLVNDIRETFNYDRLDRLTRTRVDSDTYASTTFNRTDNVRYDLLGNITSKTGVGSYLYGQNGAGIHAVTQAGNRSYRYDKNGNMISGDGRTIQWNSDNKATKITKSNGRSAEFKYGADRGRFYKKNHLGDVTLYLGSHYEEVKKASGVTEKKHYIFAGGAVVAEHIVSSEQGIQTRYFHKDALGSIDLITDAHAEVVDRRSYDAWGKLRNMPWKANATFNDPLYITQLPFTNKGYTGHESIQEVGLIHMNGRIYDATIGRFLSADPHIQEATMTQSYNRYSYVLNNPMKYTDPSGYFFKKLFKGIKKAIKGIVKVVKKVVNALKPYVGVIVGGLISTFCQVCGSVVLKAAIAGFASGAVSAAVNGGNVLQGALMGGLTGAVFGGIGISGLGNGARVLAHGVAGGALSVIQGGKFGAGFLSAAFAKFATLRLTAAGVYNMANRSFGAIIGRTTVSAILGGTGSVLGGGKFANGAKTAAFAHLFNQELSSAGSQFEPERVPDAFRRTVNVPPEYQVTRLINGRPVDMAEVYIQQAYLNAPRWEADNGLTVTQAERTAAANRLMAQMNGVVLGPIAIAGSAPAVVAAPGLVSTGATNLVVRYPVLNTIATQVAPNAVGGTGLPASSTVGWATSTIAYFAKKLF
ncbi:Rhs family protein [gamma proteobacterium IMCC1989]|nr:Rhs family protein [gamma proteobacterium IMCC1989]